MVYALITIDYGIPDYNTGYTGTENPSMYDPNDTSMHYHYTWVDPEPRQRKEKVDYERMETPKLPNKIISFQATRAKGNPYRR